MKWPDWLEDIHTNDLSSRSHVMSQVVPFLAKYGFPQKICPEPEFFLICPEFGPVPPEYLQLAEDPEFRAMLVMRRAWMRSAVLDHEDARDEADKILLMLRASLEDFEM